jgi:hypothetical protein
MTSRKNPKDLKPAGRPSTYNGEVAAEICRRIVAGEGLRGICAEPGMPHRDTVYGWLAVHPTFSDQYARAREHQADAWADELRDIADDGRNDFMDRVVADGSVERVLDSEHVQRSKLRIDTLKWLMSKHAPRRFGDKVAVDVSRKGDLQNLSDEELEARTRAALIAIGVTPPAGPLLISTSRFGPKGDDPV